MDHQVLCSNWSGYYEDFHTCVCVCLMLIMNREIKNGFN